MITLRKGQAAVSLDKTAAPIRIHVSWPAVTDYDLGALVLTSDGNVTHVARWGARGVPILDRFRGVYQTGDAGRSGGIASETLEVLMDDGILAVVPFAYSAQSNGTGSFYRHRVGLVVDNGAGGRIEMEASNASNDDRVYTCVPAIIHNGMGNVWVDPVELYSRRNSENRPMVSRGPQGLAVVTMDGGPKNAYK